MSLQTLKRQMQPNRRFLRRRRQEKERKIKRLIRLENIFEKDSKFPSYYVLSFPGTYIDSEINVIIVDTEIKQKIVIPKKMTKLNKSALLVQVSSERQGNALSNINKVAEHPVTVQLHRTLNVVKGTVYSETMSNSTEEKILEQLKEQGLTKVERMKRRVDGKLVATHRYILMFNGTKLPPLIKLAEWHREIVDLYIPTPMRCNRCQRYNHAKKWCRREKETCARCGEEDHTANQCNNDPRCVNCSGEHWATDK